MTAPPPRLHPEHVDHLDEPRSDESLYCEGWGGGGDAHAHRCAETRDLARELERCRRTLSWSVAAERLLVRLRRDESADTYKVSLYKWHEQMVC